MSLIDCQETVTLALIADLGLPALNEFTPDIELRDSDDLKVVVVPVGVENPKRLNRGNVWDEMPKIDVGVVQKVIGGVVAKDVLTVANTVREYFKGITALQGASIYTVINVNFTPFYDFDTLDEDKLVLSIVSVMFKEITV